MAPEHQGKSASTSRTATTATSPPARPARSAARWSRMIVRYGLKKPSPSRGSQGSQRRMSSALHIAAAFNLTGRTREVLSIIYGPDMAITVQTDQRHISPPYTAYHRQPYGQRAGFSRRGSQFLFPVSDSPNHQIPAKFAHPAPAAPACRPLQRSLCPVP